MFREPKYQILYSYLILTELLSEIVKLTYQLTLLTLEGHIQIKPIITIFKKVFKEAKHQI